MNQPKNIPLFYIEIVPRWFLSQVWLGRKKLLYKVKSVFFISVLLIFTTLVFFACELPEEDSEYIPTYEAEIVQEVINGKTFAFVHAWINEKTCKYYYSTTIYSLEF